MSAVLIPFPSNARALHERRRAVRQSIIDRAKEVGATVEEKRLALSTAFEIMESGGSAGWAIAVAKDLLPKSQSVAYRQPTKPFPPAAA